MAKSIKQLGVFIKPGLFDKGTGALLPEAYKKFYKEWRLTEPTAVHYIPQPGKWKRDDVTGEVLPIQNVPIPLMYPKEHNEQMWGGEGVIQGFLKKHNYKRRVPKFWFPVLKRTVVYSEILNKYISVVVTDRTLNLINSNYGFDHYILKTPACDLKSLLPLRIKRKMLEELQNGCPAYEKDPKKQEDVMKSYKGYLSAYTPEEIKWYGYSFGEACRIYKREAEEQNQPVPLKHIYRLELLEKLKIQDEAEKEVKSDMSEPTWLEKINPFGKKQET